MLVKDIIPLYMHSMVETLTPQALKQSSSYTFYENKINRKIKQGNCTRRVAGITKSNNARSPELSEQR